MLQYIAVTDHDIHNIDSGSADFWVFSTGLPANESANHTVFDPTKSSTFTSLSGYNFSIRYGDGSTASGTVGLDKVVIGGATVTQQAVEMATSVTQNFVDDTNLDGVMGLGFSNINNGTLLQPTCIPPLTNK